MNVNFETNTKANPVKQEKYYINFGDNLSQPEEDRAYVIYKPLTVEGYQRLFSINKNGNGTIPFIDIFDRQVKKVCNIHNTFTGKDLTKDEIVCSKANPTLMAIVIDVSKHIFSEATLDKDEEKN